MTKKSDSKEPKPKYFSFIVISSIAILISIFILLKILNLFSVTEKMFFYFFSASAQSMAAMFAVVGVFAVFRFQAQENKLRNLYDVFKLWFKVWEEKLASLIGAKVSNAQWEGPRKVIKEYIYKWNPTMWRDDELVKMGKEFLNEILKDQDKGALANEFKERIEEIDKHEKRRTNILKCLKTPMLAILISFMLSTVSLALTVTLSNRIIGFIILMVMLAMIAFSVISVCKYIRFSISLGR